MHNEAYDLFLSEDSDDVLATCVEGIVVDHLSYVFKEDQLFLVVRFVSVDEHTGSLRVYHYETLIWLIEFLLILYIIFDLGLFFFILCI